MSGLMGDILSTANSLTNQSSRLTVIGTNISNVNSDSYSRKSVETVSHSGPGGAVYTDSTVVSSRDGIMDRQVVEESSTSGALSEKVSMYDDLNDVMSESLNGSVGASLETAESTGAGITGGLSSFFNSWSAYSASPNSSSAQGEVYSTAEELVSRLNSASDALDEVQSDLDSTLEADVKTANNLLSKVATLNTEIISMEARETGSSATLADERQAALEDLAKIVDFDYTTESNGSVTVKLASGDSTNGQTLVSNGTAGTISITADATTGEYTGLAANYGTTSEAFTPSGGSLSVLNPTVTHAAVADLRSQLDTVANQLITSANAAYSASSTSGAAFFSGTGAGDIAIDSTITSKTDIAANSTTDLAGGNSVATAMAAIADTKYSTASGDLVNGTISESAAEVATNVAEKLNNASDASDNQDEVLSSVKTTRNNVSGVSTDEEMSDLIRTQHAYQACARVLSTIDTLLELVTTRLGA